MKRGFVGFIGKAGRNKGEKFRRQAYIFGICLLISIFIWSLVRLSAEYNYTINYSIRYTHIPYGLGLISSSDSVITVSVRLQGFEFFTEKLFQQKGSVYNVSLRKIKLRGDNGSLKGFLTTEEIGREITNQMNFPSEVYMVFPDTLFFVLKRTVPKQGKKIYSQNRETKA